MSQTLPLSGLCAHRGCHPKFPENTVPAFEEAARLGAQMVEFDVQMTRDGALVILHDPTLDRTTDGSGLLREMSLASVRNLSIKAADGQPTGLRIPTLEEALQCLPRHLWINCQIKENDAETGERVARVLKEKGRLDQTFLACQNLAAQGARAVVPEVLICNMDRKPTLAEYIETTLESRSPFIQITRKYTFGREDLLPLKERGVRINYFRAQAPEELPELFAKGVDFVLVDRLPDFLPAVR
ncbi:MAG TPA: glycerophosphodiester phosphodiesterase family protein [Chthoniobacteraceae bacterium]|nr:glycerophosphodiester phosphodiesterase family protein [Chthoniobacteraceae bacterium]